MIIEQYGLTYIRVNELDLETLRYWRNQSYIRNTMQYKEYITPKMQIKWFHNMNNKFNYYFIIHHNHKKIGIINCKDTSVNSKIAEGGIFIWDKNYWGTSIPVYASLSMLQAVFDIFQSGDASLATVAIENKIALDFNLKLGYEIQEKTSDGKYLKLYLSKEKYHIHCKKLLRAAELMSNNQSKFKLTAQVSPLQSDEINKYIITSLSKP